MSACRQKKRKNEWEIGSDEFHPLYFLSLDFVKYTYVLEINHPYLRSTWVRFWFVGLVYLFENKLLLTKVEIILHNLVSTAAHTWKVSKCCRQRKWLGIKHTGTNLCSV